MSKPEKKESQQEAIYQVPESLLNQVQNELASLSIPLPMHATIQNQMNRLKITSDGVDK